MRGVFIVASAAEAAIQEEIQAVPFPFQHGGEVKGCVVPEEGSVAADGGFTGGAVQGVVLYGGIGPFFLIQRAVDGHGVAGLGNPQAGSQRAALRAVQKGAALGGHFCDAVVVVCGAADGAVHQVFGSGCVLLLVQGKELIVLCRFADGFQTDGAGDVHIFLVGIDAPGIAGAFDVLVADGGVVCVEVLPDVPLHKTPVEVAGSAVLIAQPAQQLRFIKLGIDKAVHEGLAGLLGRIEPDFLTGGKFRFVLVLIILKGAGHGDPHVHGVLEIGHIVSVESIAGGHAGAQLMNQLSGLLIMGGHIAVGGLVADVLVPDMGPALFGQVAVQLRQVSSQVLLAALVEFQVGVVGVGSLTGYDLHLIALNAIDGALGAEMLGADLLDAAFFQEQLHKAVQQRPVVGDGAVGGHGGAGSVGQKVRHVDKEGVQPVDPHEFRVGLHKAPPFIAVSGDAVGFADDIQVVAGVLEALDQLAPELQVKGSDLGIGKGHVPDGKAHGDHKVAHGGLYRNGTGIEPGGGIPGNGVANPDGLGVIRLHVDGSVVQELFREPARGFLDGIEQIGVVVQQLDVAHVMGFGQAGREHRVAVSEVGENDFRNGEVAVGPQDDLGGLRLVPGGFQGDILGRVCGSGVGAENLLPPVGGPQAVLRYGSFGLIQFDIGLLGLGIELLHHFIV